VIHVREGDLVAFVTENEDGDPIPGVAWCERRPDGSIPAGMERLTRPYGDMPVEIQTQNAGPRA
jgi:hypothetical protein